VSTAIGLLGDLDRAKPTHRELEAAVAMLPDGVEARWIGTYAPEARALTGLDGLWVFPGSPYRDDDAVFAAIEWALDADVPFLGTCSGFQYSLIILARRAGLADAAHAETDPSAERPLVAPLTCSLIGEEREVRPVPGTRLEAILGPDPFSGFHWCGYGLDESFVPALVDAGVVISANAPDAGVEAIELPAHPFFHATLFQPQVGALEGRPLSPLILAFLAVAAK
jgi:CTP synthase (UTP-ammonia lyase)